MIKKQLYEIDKKYFKGTGAQLCAILRFWKSNLFRRALVRGGQRWGCLTYAQTAEDLILLNIFSLLGVEKGFLLLIRELKLSALLFNTFRKIVIASL